MLRCPLCLQSLADGTAMVRYCRRHPGETAPFTVSLTDFSGIFCPEPHKGERCTPSGQIEDGVFLFHVGCPCTSPFVVPGTSNIDVANRRGLGSGALVEHWEIAVADEIARAHNRPEMWFPQALFRAANERDPAGNAPLGCLVLLAGAQSVGKTVLSLMAMNPMVYASTRPVQHFAHISNEYSNEDLLRVLDALNQFQSTGIQPAMMPTSAADVSNVKSVFVTRGSIKARDRRASQSFDVVDVLRDIKERFLPTGAAGPSVGASHTAVAFYDTSGELWQKAGGVNLFRLREEVDVHAIVADMSAFTYFGRAGAATNSSWVARQQLERAQTSAGLRCLVVTKLDAVIGATPPPAMPIDLSTLADSIRSGEPPAAAYREVLRACLEKSQDQHERRLWSLIDRDRQLQIFFVWTEGLDSSADAAVQSVGLEAFVDWCLSNTAAFGAAATR